MVETSSCIACNLTSTSYCNLMDERTFMTAARMRVDIDQEISKPSVAW